MNQELAAKLEGLAHELLRAAAALTGDKHIEGVAPDVYLKDPKSYPGYAWRYLQMIWDENEKPREFKPWGMGVLPEEAGGRGSTPKAYDQYRAMWEQAQRDFVFNMQSHLPLGKEGILNALKELYFSPWGVGWRNDPRTKGMIPDGPPKE